MGITLLGKLTKIIFTFLALSFFTMIVPQVNYSQSSQNVANKRFNGSAVIIDSTSETTSDRSIADEIGTDDLGGSSESFEENSGALPTDPPTLAFTASSLSVNEDDGNVTIEVKLVEANGTEVEVEIAFLGSSSSASGADIASYSTETVSFAASDPSGATKTVSITLTEDSDYEGNETAVFELQNNTSGAIIEPDVLNLKIQDNDVPDIVINEIHADPDETNGDADVNGAVSDSDDEFIEFVNNESDDIDISNWTVSDADELRHTFPPGTVIPAGGAIVLFANNNVSPVGSFGGVSIQSTNESSTLSLDNTGDTIELADGSGNIVVDYSYGSEADGGQSITRDPDITGSFVKHSIASSSGGELFSPGTKIDGSSFGSKFAIGIRGSEGWRMVSVPTQNTSFDDLFGDFWMQGLTGSNAPSAGATVYKWDEQGGGSFLAPTDMTDKLEAGKGYLVYFFEDDAFDTPGVQGGFPKIVNMDNAENSSSVSVEVSANDDDGSGTINANEGWNLIGNPFGTSISVDAVLAALEAVDPSINANIQIWDHSAGSGNGAYVDLGPGKTIAPFQAFWIRYMKASGVSGSATFNRSDLVAKKGDQLYKQQNEEQFGFTISLGDGTYYDQYSVKFEEKGSIDLDPHDAYKLFSLKTNSVNLYSLSADNKLMKSVLPVDLETSIEVPLSFVAPGRESLSLNWEGLENLPENWEISLLDRELDKEIDLRSVSEYSFTVPGAVDNQKINENVAEPQLNKTKTEKEETRFVLSVNPSSSEETSTTDIPESVKLNPNYPNPFNPTTTISYELKEDSEVLLSVWNIVGQKVVTLVDGVKEAGEHTASWNASEMPSGIYIAQLEVSGEVFIRKMTLIK